MVASWPSSVARSANRTSSLSQVLERQLAVDAAVVRMRERGHGERRSVEGVALPDGQRAVGGDGARFGDLAVDGVVELRVRQPAARAVLEGQVPLVPRARVVLVDDAARHGERIVFETTRGTELDGRWIGGELGDLADFAQIQIPANEHRSAVRADRLHGSGPPELDRRAAVRARCPWCGHQWSRASSVTSVSTIMSTTSPKNWGSILSAVSVG